MIVVSQWGDGAVVEFKTVTVTTEDSDMHYLRVNGLLFGRFESYDTAKILVEVMVQKFMLGIGVFYIPREEGFIEAVEALKAINEMDHAAGKL